VGGVAHEFGELGACAIEDGWQEEGVVVGECLMQLAQVGSGRLVGKNMVGESAESKYFVVVQKRASAAQILIEREVEAFDGNSALLGEKGRLPKKGEIGAVAPSPPKTLTFSWPGCSFG
jgi:hypothetical protein